MAEYRRAEASELPEIIDFINMVFSMSSRPHNFKVLIPKAYGDAACMYPEHYIAKENGKVVGAVGLLPMKMRVLGEEILCGGVGSVSAHPYAHGAGHMRGCMNAMLEDAKARGIELMYLGGMRQRYEYFGFSQGGVGMTFSLRAGNVKHAMRDADDSGYTFAELNPYQTEAKALFESQPVCAIRGDHFLQIAGTWEALPFAICKGGRFVGYLIADSDKGEITEICLSDEGDLPGMLKAWMSAWRLSSLRVDAPVWNKERVRYLSRVSQRAECGYIDMFRVENWEKTLRLWLTLKSRYARLMPGKLVVRVDGGAPIAIEVAPNGAVGVRETSEAPDICVNRLEAQDLFLASQRWFDTDALPAFVENWFPLPISLFRADGF